MELDTCILDTWEGCYPSQWKGLMVDEAICHPAKISSKLAKRIYDHMREEGWIPEGSIIIDVFAGVAGFALDAMRLGLRWVGCELEPRFANLGNQNIAAWNARFSTMPHWGEAVLIQGDSRNLAQVLGGADGCISSPPYGKTPVVSFTDDIERLREAGYSPEKILTPGRRAHGNLGEMEHYGVTPGQLGAMKADGFKAVVSSPPFKGQSADGGWQMLGKYAEEGKLTVVQVGGDSSKSYPSWNKERDTSYGHAEGQLADMAEGLFEAAVSSPPFEKSETGGALPPEKYPQIGGPIFGYRKETTGCSDGNISNDSGDNFWSAAKQIVEQVYQVLAPGGHAVWVLKAFVKNKAIVDFPGQWRQLCEAVGFETLHEHHASLVKEKGTHYLLDGGKIHKTTKNASFFRRLAESKGSPEINWETVLCMQKHVLTVEQS